MLFIPTLFGAYHHLLCLTRSCHLYVMTTFRNFKEKKTRGFNVLLLY